MHYASSSSSQIVTVEWDAGLEKFVAWNDAGQALAASANRANAIGGAIRFAKSASRDGACVAVRVLLHDGRYRTEYIAEPSFRRP